MTKAWRSIHQLSVCHLRHSVSKRGTSWIYFTGKALTSRWRIVLVMKTKPCPGYELFLWIKQTKNKICTAAYHTLSCHTKRSFILPARRPIDHSVWQSHVEPEPNGTAVEFTKLIPRNWKEIKHQHYISQQSQVSKAPFCPRWVFRHKA